MKSLLIKNGPIGTVIHASLLDNYKGGIIYSDINCNTNLNDYHAVTIVGYAKDHYDQDYWIVRNSYGAGWGENGYFKVLAGQDICGIESMVYNFNITWDSWCGEGCDQCDYESYNLSVKVVLLDISTIIINVINALKDVILVKILIHAQHVERDITYIILNAIHV